MKVGVIQSCYLPWRGSFDFIDSVDLFIIHDDIQMTKQDWRNRNKIKTPDGVKWITVPCIHGPVSQLIQDTRVDYGQKWQNKHINLLTQSYGKAPFFKEYAPEIFATLKVRYDSISALNVALTKLINRFLEIRTPIRMSSEFQLSGTKTARLIELMTKLQADCYVSGPAAKDYIQNELFAEKGIRLEYKSYDYPEYPQLYGAFEPAVSVLDLLFNAGPEARKYLKSRQPNECAVC